MATANKDGTDADFSYTPLGGAATTHLLAVRLLISPAQGFSSLRRPRRFEAWNEDLTVREVFTLGTPVDEIQATIRFEDEPASLRSMLEEGLENDVTLTYRPTGAGGDTFDAKLVSVAGGDTIQLTPDRDRFAFGEYETTIRLRRVDGGDFEDLL